MTTTLRSEARLQQSLDEVTRLLDKHRVLETLAHRQEGPKRDLLEGLQHRQNLAELGKRVRTMHGADLAFVLEALRPDDRRLVWEQAPPDQAGLAFVEVTGVVREWLVEATPHDGLVRMLLTLDPEDLGYVSESIPKEILKDVSRALESADRQAFEDSIQYDEEQVGHHMTREWVMVNESSTVQDDRRAASTGRVPAADRSRVVVDSRHVFRGSIPRRRCSKIPRRRSSAQSRQTQSPSSPSSTCTRR